ncbi:MAG: DUF2207 domain-containing protein [Bacilli bacterium]|nr:DUF2207 domain-containing protein [Bacilli bacterium]
MKRNNGISVAIVLLVIFAFALCFSFCMVLEDDSESVADGFTINSYNVKLDVAEDNKVKVVEEITVDWYEEYHHGLFKFTPEWLKYTGKDNKTIRRKSNISNLEVIDEQYSIDTVKNKKRIKIGSPNEYVPLGLKTYTISYLYDMGSDPFKGFDELIFHAFGDYWGTEINSASIEINMPKSIEGDEVNFFTDKYRKNNVNDVVDYTVTGNKLVANFNRDKYYDKQYAKYCDNASNILGDGSCDRNAFDTYYEPLTTALTVDIELPEGYFTDGSWNYSWGSFSIFIIIILLTFYTLIVWYRYGKDLEKKAETLEFYPPDNLSAAEIGYIYGKESNKKLTISLIIELASKGYLKIDEEGKWKKKIKITNLAVLPTKVSEIDEDLPKREIKVKKLKDVDSKLNFEETVMMNFLFKKKDERVLSANIEKFMNVRDSLVKNGYIEVLSDNDNELKKEYKAKKVEYDNAMEKYNKEMEKYNNIVSKLPAMTDIEKIVYDILFEATDEVILRDHKGFYKAFSSVNYQLENEIRDKAYDSEASSKIKWSFFRTLFIIVLSCVSYFKIADFDPKFSIIYWLSFLCVFINIFLIIIMGRKTEYGEIIYARIKGFRKFLLTAEKKRIEELVNENPNYFYDILPYTYVLNVSKKWVKKFEDIPMPDVDMGNFDYSDIGSYSHMYNDVYYPQTSSSGGSSSGCSSCGGGCSSCGGGCSSCGGGGSW